jgi:TrmH family RNA methyltransferase
MPVTITSVQNDRVKLAYGLLSGSKSRRKAGKIALEGVRLIQDAVGAGYLPDFLLYDPQALDASVFDVPSELIFDASAEVIRHISGTEQPQGIVGVFPMPAPTLPATPQRVLILDAISDPGNLGSILRTAAAAGVEAVLLAPGCVDPYNDKALRGGMGAHFRVPVLPQSWEKIAAGCAGLNIFLAEMEGELAYDAADWTQGWALIIGSEAHGATESARQFAEHHVFIPMAAATESLNAASATAVILFEAARQRRAANR